MFRPNSEMFRGIFFRLPVFFCFAGLVGKSQIENLTLIFCFQKIFFLTHHGDLWSNGKHFVLSKCITVNFSKNKIFNLKVCWIKPFISGFGPNPIELWAPTGRPHWLLQPYSCEALSWRYCTVWFYWNTSILIAKGKAIKLTGLNYCDWPGPE